MLRSATAFFLILLLSPIGLGLRCDRTPLDVSKPRTPTHGEFILEINGNPTSYVSGYTYKVILKGSIIAHEQRRFTNFLLLIEPYNPDDHSQHNSSVGMLQLQGDMLTKYSDKCPNAVEHTNSVGKTHIMVHWTAPVNGTICVALKATVVESIDRWYSEDGELTKVLCPESQDNEDYQPPVLEDCCACHEAKYEVTFEGLWSRNTHPKDFPKNNWVTRFSDIIGASHTVNYTFWSYGSYSSEGLQQLAENGNTRELERELKDKSEHIRTIIKARGISYPNITGKTFAVFRVDKKHHLMSLVSMIHPSPDWIVGVSSLELCLSNCSWVEGKVLNLYPWDAGTDDGETYISADKPAWPHQPIRRIMTNDSTSPFYDDSGAEMKPLARLILSRQRLYEKNCKTDGGDPYPDPGKLEGYCDVTDWSEWSSCSAKCGRGMRHKQRRYKNQDPDYARQQSFCKQALTKRSSCTAKTCFNPGEVDEDCELSGWGAWSSCSAICGHGTKTRSRNYKTKNAAKVCPFKFFRPPALQENMPCFEKDCESQEEPPIIPEECQDLDWSEWSTCSTTCGKGIKIRKKLPFKRNKTYQRNRRHYESDFDYDKGDEDDVFEGSDVCEDVTETVECESEQQPECDEAFTRNTCSLPMESGLCRSFVDRWYYNLQRNKCELFNFSGCEGNSNNFRTLETCEKLCGYLQTNKSNVNRQQVEPNDEPHFATIPIESGSLVANDVDCKVSEWSNWSECDVQCGKGHKYKYRHVTRPAENNGKPCPDKLVKTKKCRVHCKNEKTTENPADVDCVMGDWSRWSPCSHTCGPNAIRQRTRNIIVRPSGRGEPCLDRVQYEHCNLSACHAY